MLTFSLFVVQYLRVHSIDALMPSDDEKLPISTANWIEGTARSCRLGGEHFVVKTKIRPATKRFKSSGESGSPYRRPTLEGKGVPNAVPNLIHEDAFLYMFSITEDYRI